MIIVTVLKSGGEYTSNHVRWLHNQIPSGYRHICVTDSYVEGVETIPLRYNWRGWFSKLELFDPNLIKDDLFYIDLDSVICGEIELLFKNKDLSALDDFYFPERASSGLMYIPQDSKDIIWKDIASVPNFYRFRGDGELLDYFVEFERWQFKFPGKIVSYKKHIAKEGMPGYHGRFSVGDGTLPPEACIVCFHGYPRPWQIDEDWIPRL